MVEEPAGSSGHRAQSCWAAGAHKPEGPLRVSGRRATGSDLGHSETTTPPHTAPPTPAAAAFPVTQTVKNLLAMQETWVRSLAWEITLE